MHFKLIPNAGSEQLQFGMPRAAARSLIPESPLLKPDEPENDFYISTGVILGFDGQDRLNFIEIIEPSTAEILGIQLFNASLEQVVSGLRQRTDSVTDNPTGPMFPSIGFVIYAPSGTIESASVFARDYYG